MVEIAIRSVSILAPTAMALGRALIVAGLAIALAGGLAAWLGAQRGRAEKWAWALLLAPLFTPPLLISYAYARVAITAPPWGRELLYLAVLALKLAPVAVLVATLLPSPLSAAARHLYRAQARPNTGQLLLFHLRGAGEGLRLGAALVFLVAFADFELASLWSLRSWTVTIFDAQVGGLALGDTLRLAALPLFVEIGVLALLARRRPAAVKAPPVLAPDRRHAPWIYLGAVSLVVTVLPLVLIAGQAAAGLRSLTEHFVLGREIGVSMLFAAAAAICAQALASLAPLRFARTLAAPGLLGALVLALVVLALFQTPPLRWAYDTPLPLVLALTALLLPPALLLRALWQRRSPALHLAMQSAHPQLRWHLHTRPRALALGLLFGWAYFEFTASSILAPIGFTPVFSRLHNLAHYGQTAVLSAMLLAAFAVPILAVLLAGGVARFSTSRR